MLCHWQPVFAIRRHLLLALLPDHQAKAKHALHDIWRAETRVDAKKASNPFIKTL